MKISTIINVPALLASTILLTTTAGPALAQAECFIPFPWRTDMCFLPADSRYTSRVEAEEQASQPQSNDEYKQTARIYKMDLKDKKTGVIRPLPSGYIAIRFNLVGEDGKAYTNTGVVERIRERTLGDWLARFVNDKSDGFIVTVNVHDGLTKENLIGSQVITALTYDDGWRSIVNSNDRVLGGTLGFYRKSNLPHTVSISIKSFETNNVSLERVQKIVETANEVQGALPTGVTSLVSDAALSTFNSVAGTLNELLGEFEDNVNISVVREMKREHGGVERMMYDFTPPAGADNFAKVNLSIELHYKDSLLLDNGFETNNILSSKIYTPQGAVVTLLDYISSSEARDSGEDFSEGNIPLQRACRELQETLVGILQNKDVLLALNAYMVFLAEDFNSRTTNSSDLCVTESSAEILRSVAGLDLSPQIAKSLEQHQSLDPISLTVTQQSGPVKILTRILRNSKSQVNVDEIAEDFEFRVGGDYAIEVQDPNQILFPQWVTSLPAKALVQILASDTPRLDRGLGCYEGEVWDIVGGRQNNFGTLGLIGSKPVEVLFEFSETPTNVRTPELQRIIVSEPTQDRLLKYRDRDGRETNRAQRGCAGSFKPWELQTASN